LTRRTSSGDLRRVGQQRRQMVRIAFVGAGGATISTPGGGSTPAWGSRRLSTVALAGENYVICMSQIGGDCPATVIDAEIRSASASATVSDTPGNRGT